jgi:3-oxoacyl-[acyl-carrier-protein] synthase-1
MRQNCLTEVKSYTAIHPLGFSAAEIFDSVAGGKSGLTEIRRDFLEKPVYAACFSDEQNSRLESLCPFENWNRFERLVWLAGTGVLEKSGITRDDRVLFIIATAKGGIEEIGNNPDNLSIHLSVKKVIDKLSSGYGNMTAPPFCIVSNACVSGLSAMIAGKRFLDAQNCDCAVIIGADTVNDFVLSGFNSLFALSDKPCRPFDRARNGINLGEGAAAVALRRNSREDKNFNPPGIFLSGGATTNDANHISGPSRTGQELAEAIKRSVSEANVNAKFDFLSAHGTATVYNDEMESRAFAIAGLSDIPVHSLKPYTGHTLGAAGILESVICFESLVNNILIPASGYAENGTGNKLNIQTVLEKKEISRFIKSASGFGGCNAAACFEKR